MKQWNPDELQLAILRILLDERKRQPQNGGKTSKGLADRLGYGDSDIGELGAALQVLIDCRLITDDETKFLITACGVDFVEEKDGNPSPPDDQHRPPDDQPGAPDPPWSPGDPRRPWPPGTDPDDPSRVPLRPKPSGGRTEKTLKHPNSDGLHA